MEVMRYRVKLDMEDSGILKTQMRLKQGDSAITLVFKIMKNGVDVFNEEDVPVVVFRRPDGTSIVGDASVAEGQYTYSLEGNELQIAGQMIADVKFNVNSARESTCSFSFECVPDTMSPDTDPAGVFVNSLKDIIDAVQKGVEQVEQAVEIFDVQQIIDLKNQIEALIEQLPDFTVDDAFSDTSEHAIMNKVVTQAIDSIQNALNSLSAVATSGSYNDLTDKPDEYSLPVASESTLGGVKAVNKTAEMTQAVGIDADGNLYAEAGGEKFIDLANEAAYDELTPEEKAQNCYVYEAEEVEPSAETIAYEQGGAESIKTVVENGIYENITNSLSISSGLSVSRKTFIKSGCIYNTDVFIYGDNNPMTNNAIIATISEEYRPRRQVFLNGACGLRYGNRYPCIFVIGTDGTVKISFNEGGISSVGEACLFGTYIG